MLPSQSFVSRGSRGARENWAQMSFSGDVKTSNALKCISLFNDKLFELERYILFSMINYFNWKDSHLSNE
jgi:hypothetical protein